MDGRVRFGLLPSWIYGKLQLLWTIEYGLQTSTPLIGSMYTRATRQTLADYGTLIA